MTRLPNETCQRTKSDTLPVGYDFHALSHVDSDLLRTYRSIFSPGRAGRILAVLGIFLPAWVVRVLPSVCSVSRELLLIVCRFKRNNDINQASDVIKAHCRSLITNKRNSQREKHEDSDDRPDILEVAFRSGGFTDEELVNQLMTFLAAGHETTASALTWTVYLLCKHPEVQARLRKEIFSSNTNGTSIPELDDLPFLAAVINETLRLFPPVSLTVRDCVRDTVVAGEHIPKGTAVILPPWAVNAAVDSWGEDALDFVPERWLAPSKGHETRSNFSFVTFLHGPRSCIGEKFARAELAFLVIAWVTAFDTQLADENFIPQVGGGITAKPKGGLHVKVRPLD